MKNESTALNELLAARQKLEIEAKVRLLRLQAAAHEKYRAPKILGIFKN